MAVEGRAVQLPLEEPYWENWDSMVTLVDEHNRAAFGMHLTPASIPNFSYKSQGSKRTTF